MKIRQKGLKEKLQPKVKSHTAKYIKHVRKRNKAKENLLKSPGINFKIKTDHFGHLNFTVNKLKLIKR